MNKAFASVLGLVAVVGATVGALPASAGYGTVVRAGTGTTNLAASISGTTGTVNSGSTTNLANTSAGATLTIGSTAFTQYQSLVAVKCGAAGASDYSVGFSNSVSCPSGTTLSSSEALISVN